MASERARMVLAWIDALEARVDLTEHYEDIIADHRFAQGRILLLAVPPDLPTNLDVLDGR